MIDAGELVIAIMTMVALAETIYLRRDLEEHGLSFWVYVAFPLLALTSFIIVAWDELPEGVAETLSYYFGALTVVAFFIGTVLAFRRR